ncbi:hypothetical protein [Tolypothrix sp. VBCCA 56010]|uniref:hypothetical protein n=1 Tax=Tolypothrix sp. VBCCA 56010 TaxID=3137731 RepID=UPI003D7EF674
MARKEVFTSDRDDKGDLSIQFTPLINYTPAEVEAGNKLVEILNNPSLNDAEKKDAVWDILKGA